MSLVSPASRTDICSGCRQPSDALVASVGDQLCERCRAVFRTAEVLLNEGIVEEDVLIPTLVFAKIAGGSEGYEALSKQGYPITGLDIVRLMHAASGGSPEGLEQEAYAGWVLLRVVRGVPFFRVLPLAAKSEMHPGTRVLKGVCVQVLSRKVKPADVQQEYERLLAEQGARWTKNNAGEISYRATNGYLEIVAGTGGNLSPLTAESVGKDLLLSWPSYHFPPPVLVAGIYQNLLGSADKRNAHGFAYMLDVYGKANTKTAKKIIHAFAAWHVGEGHPGRIALGSHRRVARVLNRQLLDPGEHLPEDTWTANDKIWRDVEELAMRFVRLYAGGYGHFFTRT
jgi:hypothetical protein